MVQVQKQRATVLKDSKLIGYFHQSLKLKLINFDFEINNQQTQNLL